MPFEIPQKTEQEQRVLMGRIALEAIAAHILTVPPENISMRTWCGTAQCAIGHGLSLPEVRATGLYLTPFDGIHNTHIPEFNGARGQHAIAEAFGIDVETSKFMFGGCLDCREEVSIAIRHYLARTG